MDQQRQAEYEKCRDAIASWSQEYSRTLQEAMSTGGTLPSAPSSTNDAYKRALRMAKEEDRVLTSAFASLPPGDLNIASAIAVIEAIDGLLHATHET